jgi:hypothetical protein
MARPGTSMPPRKAGAWPSPYLETCLPGYFTFLHMQETLRQPDRTIYMGEPGSRHPTWPVSVVPNCVEEFTGD